MYVLRKMMMSFELSPVLYSTSLMYFWRASDNVSSQRFDVLIRSLLLEFYNSTSTNGLCTSGLGVPREIHFSNYLQYLKTKIKLNQMYFDSKTKSKFNPIHSTDLLYFIELLDHYSGMRIGGGAEKSQQTVTSSFTWK